MTDFELPSISDFPPEVQKTLRGMADAFLTDKTGGPRDNPPLSKMRLLSKAEYIPDAPTNLCKRCAAPWDDHVLSEMLKGLYRRNPDECEYIAKGTNGADEKK